jgi:hypothetical protein
VFRERLKFSEFLRDQMYVGLYDNEGINNFLRDPDSCVWDKISRVSYVKELVCYYPGIDLNLLFNCLDDETLGKYFALSDLNLLHIRYIEKSKRFYLDQLCFSDIVKFKHDVTKLSIFDYIIMHSNRNITTKSIPSIFDLILYKLAFFKTEELEDDIEEIVKFLINELYNYFNNNPKSYELEYNEVNQINSSFIYNVRGDEKRNTIMIDYFIDTIIGLYRRDSKAGLFLYKLFEESKHKALVFRLADKYQNDKDFKRLNLEATLKNK